MIHPELLAILRCPETRQKLVLADSALLQNLNAQFESKQLRNRAGRSVSEKLEGGLVREDGKFVYPIRHGLPIMLIDEAIPLS